MASSLLPLPLRVQPFICRPLPRGACATSLQPRRPWFSCRLNAERPARLKDGAPQLLRAGGSSARSHLLPCSGLRPPGPERQHHDEVGRRLVDARRVRGDGDDEQLPAVPADPGARVDGGVVVGQEGGDLVHRRRAGHGAGRLLQVQGRHPALLQEDPLRRRPPPGRPLQPADRQLLQGRRRLRLRPGPRRLRLRLPDLRRPRRHHQQDRQAPHQLHPHGTRPRLHLRPRQGRPLHRLLQPRPPPQDPGAHDLDRHLHLLPAARVQVPHLLRLLLLLLQRHHRAVRPLRLRLRTLRRRQRSSFRRPFFFPRQQPRRRRRRVHRWGLEARAVGRREHAAQGRGAAAAVHAAHVPDQGALARQAQLQGLLAGQDRHHQLQLPDELHAVDAGGAAPQPGQRHRGLQLPVQAAAAVRLHQRYRHVLRPQALQRSAHGGRALRQRPVGAAHAQGRQDLHLKPGMGVPAQDLLQRRRVQDAAAGLVPLPAQRRPGRRGDLFPGDDRRRHRVPAGDDAPGGVIPDEGFLIVFHPMAREQSRQWHFVQVETLSRHV